MSEVTIADQVGEMARRAADQPPDPRMEAFAREAAELREAGLPDGVAAVGTVLPDAQLIGADGAPRSLSDAVGGQLAVVVLYRGAWCPYCNIALRTYQLSLLPTLAQRQVPLVAISPQTPDGSMAMREKQELEFDVLSDTGNEIARAIGVLTQPTADSLRAQRELGVDLEAVNADGSVGIPMPTTAILDEGLTIRWIDVHPDYTTRSEVVEILAALDRLDGGGSSGAPRRSGLDRGVRHAPPLGP
jgi:peroxiredoxin